MQADAYPLPAIHTEADYQAALKLAAPHFDHEPAQDSAAGAHFKALLALIEAYEARHYPTQPQNPV